MIERYEKIIRRRKAVGILFTVLGSITLLILLATRGNIVPRHMQSFFVSTGIAWFLNGIINFRKKNKLLRDRSALKQAAVIEFDERNTEVMRRSCTLTLYILLVAVYAAVIISAYISARICYTLLATLCSGLAIWFVCYAVVWKTI